MHNDRTLISI